MMQPPALFLRRAVSVMNTCLGQSLILLNVTDVKWEIIFCDLVVTKMNANSTKYCQMDNIIINKYKYNA